ncbi:hypothetical protein HDU96_009115 [Phlyctochytrium bullatum]|nr:hypothetical protein HDU96_009115 [Phlyctochytrium bullatum]
MGLKRKTRETASIDTTAGKGAAMVAQANTVEMDGMLPFEVVHQILLNVDVKTRCRCCLVSKRWNRVLYNSPDLWRVLDVSSRQTLGGEKFMETDPDTPRNVNATLLRLFRGGGTAAFDPYYDPTHRPAYADVLADYTTRSTPVDSAVFVSPKPEEPKRPSAAAAPFPTSSPLPATLAGSLPASSLRWHPLTLPDPVRPHRFSRITRLDVSCTFVDPATLAHPEISGILAASLTSLSLNGCPLVTSGSLAHLACLKKLLSLDLSHCDGVDDGGLEVLARFVPWLRNLNLSYLFKVTDAGVRRLYKMSGLQSLNLMGCCRIKSYPWAISNDRPNSTVALRELSVGEDSRIQTRGFWLLWCTWQQWDMGKVARICPFLETLRLNMVLFDLPSGGIEALLTGCKNLKHLSLVADRNIIPSLCTVAPMLNKLNSLDLTVHIGVTAEHFKTLVDSGALASLAALKFHSKHTIVFDDQSLKNFFGATKKLEFLELNGDELSPTCLESEAPKFGKNLQSLLMHHFKLSNESFGALSKACRNLRELTLTDLQHIDDVSHKPSAVSSLRRGASGVPAPTASAGQTSSAGNSGPSQTRSGYAKVPDRDTRTPPRLSSNRLSLIVSDPQMALKLKKIEISSTSEGFKDKDLALIPTACKNLQWADFQFPFTFPKTSIALADSCGSLLFLRLARVVPPQAYGMTSAVPPSGANAGGPRLPNNNNAATAGTGNANYGAGAASTSSGPGGTRRPASRTPSPRASTSASPKTAGDRRGSSTWSSNGGPRPTFLCSSPESQGLLRLSDPARSAAAKKLRVLDVTGDLGMSDHVLAKGLSRLASLHTVFLDSVEGISERGIREFAEVRWGTLKRLHLRNCKSCKVGLITENFVTRALEVDLVVDGGRLVGSSGRLAEDV